MSLFIISILSSVLNLVLSVFLLICLSLLVLLYIHSSLRYDAVTGLSQGYSEMFTFFIIIIISV